LESFLAWVRRRSIRFENLRKGSTAAEVTPDPLNALTGVNIDITKSIIKIGRKRR
jgi:hypothetical protein